MGLHYHILDNGRSSLLIALANCAAMGEDVSIRISKRGVTVKSGPFTVCRNSKPETFRADFEKGVAVIRAVARQAASEKAIFDISDTIEAVSQTAESPMTPKEIATAHILRRMKNRRKQKS